jgi:colanic acid/amylovoran biosynthesis glycosyltransferase
VKIAFIVGAFPALPETFILNQITGLLDLGCEVEIFARYNPKEGKTHSDVRKYGLMERAFYFNIPQNRILFILKAFYLIFFALLKNPVNLLKLPGIFKQGKKFTSIRLIYVTIPFLKKKFDIIHCHFGENGILSIHLKKMHVSDVVITAFHGHDLSKFVSTHGAGVYEDLFLDGDLFLPISDYWRRKLVALNCDEGKILVHHMGIDLGKFKYQERKTSSAEPIRVLTIGRLVEKKGHKYLIKAVAKSLKTHKNILCMIAGDGPCRAELESLASDLGIADHIKFLGTLTHEEVSELFQQAHIFILPSVTASDGDQEGIPVVLMEAQAVGLPVISTYHSGIPELVIDGKSGFLVPERDIDILAEKIVYLIEHPEKWAEMGRCGRRIVEEEFNIKKLNNQLLKIYQSLLEN